MATSTIFAEKNIYHSNITKHIITGAVNSSSIVKRIDLPYKGHLFFAMLTFWSFIILNPIRCASKFRTFP